MTSPAYYRLFTIDGRLLDQVAISEEVQRIERPMQAGAYVVIVYYAGMTYKFKVIIP
jgi:hypothetical protein